MLKNILKRGTIYMLLIEHTISNRPIPILKEELITIRSKNFKFNSKVLPIIVEEVITCA